MSQKSIRVKKKERLMVPFSITCPDLNYGMSYETKNRKMRVYIDDKLVATLSSNEGISVQARVRAVVKAERIFEREDGSVEIDLTQKYIVGQNFIEATFNSGKVRRKPVSFEESNDLILLRLQDFWR